MTTENIPSATARGSRLFEFLSLQAGEGRPVASLAGLNFAVSAAFVLVQTSAFGLFIEVFGSDALPYAYFSIAVFSSLVGYLYLRLSQRVSFAAGLYLNLAFLAAVCLVFWLGLRSNVARWFIFFLPFWFQTLVNLANLVVWHLAQHTFNVRQAKRLFGLIVAGNWLANILGGVLVVSLLALASPSDLYLLAAGALLLSMLVLRSATSSRQRTTTLPTEPLRRRILGRSGVRSAFDHPYSRLIFAYTLLWWLSFFVLENIFFHQVEQRLESSGALASFLGWQLAVMGVIALFTSSILTGRVVRSYGLRLGLIAMPVAVTLVVLLLALGGALGWSVGFLFWTATIARTLNISLGFSLSLAVGSLLFQPLVGDLRSAAHTIAESIMQPIAIGLAGIILLLFNTILKFDSAHLSYVFLAVAIPWFWSIFALARRYPVVMSEALKKRAWGDTTTLLFDAAALQQLRDALRQPRRDLSLYALNQLELLTPQAWPRILVEELPRLLQHPAQEVRLEAVRRTLSLQQPQLLPILRRGLHTEREPRVLAMLMRALAAARDAQSRDRIRAALESPEPALQAGAIIGLLSAGDLDDAAQALAALNGLGTSQSAEERIAACEILGQIRHPDAVALLLRLMQDPAWRVRAAALRAAPGHRAPGLIGAELDACSHPATVRLAERALIQHGSQDMQALLREVGGLKPQGQSSRRALSLVRVLGRIENPRSIELLLPLVNSPDAVLRLQALLGLSRRGYRSRSPAETYERVRSEMSHAASLAAALNALQGRESWAVLRHALERDFRDTRGRILLLLSFQYDARVVLRARDALEREDGQPSPVALETIDALLPPTAKPLVLPLLEDISHARRLERWRSLGLAPPDLSPEGVLHTLLGVEGAVAHSPWTRMCAMHMTVSAGVRSCLGELEKEASGSHPGLRAMSSWAVARLSTAPRPPGDLQMLSLVEKVLILKSTPLFAQTPDHVLAEIADLVEQVSFEAGQTIFKKGDRGDSLYVIVSGAVKITDGERLLNELREGEAFGELGLLDPERRLGTASAAEPTGLLRLDAPHFQEVLDSQPEVSSAIIRVITKYLRSQLQFAQEASTRLKALESMGHLTQPEAQ